MNTHGEKIRSGHHLAYRLRKSVRHHLKNGSLYLILNYPLKAFVLNPVWESVISLLSTETFISFYNISPLIEQESPEIIESFLNDLVRKGFLENKGYPHIDEYPFVSIIIPVRNRPEEIDACLQSLSRIDYPADNMEVIVVDDASDDNTPDVVSKFSVNLISLKERGQASFCRNLASQRAEGKILAFLDSDCVVDPSWLKELIPAFSNSSNGAVGGLVDSYFNEKGLDRYEKVKSSLNMGTWTKSSREIDRFFYLPSCNLLVRTSLFQELDGFREDMIVGEDVDFCWRLQDKGHHVEYRPVGRVYHKHRNRIRSFCARRFDYGTSEPILQRSHTKRIKQFFLPPAGSIFWAAALLTLIFKYMPLLGLCGIILFIDSLRKLVKIRHRGVPIKFPFIIIATVRSYLAFFYHCCAFISRYYLFWAIIILPFAPLASAIILCAHFLTGLVEYFIKRPELNPFSFLFYFSLDQLFYQMGVWWGCLKRHYFGPVNPQVVKTPSLKI